MHADPRVPVAVRRAAVGVVVIDSLVVIHQPAGHRSAAGVRSSKENRTASRADDETPAPARHLRNQAIRGYDGAQRGDAPMTDVATRVYYRPG
jgi:hypothetical protein